MKFTTYKQKELTKAYYDEELTLITVAEKFGISKSTAMKYIKLHKEWYYVQRSEEKKINQMGDHVVFKFKSADNLKKALKIMEALKTIEALEEIKKMKEVKLKKGKVALVDDYES